MVLNQKINDLVDTDSEFQSLKKKNRELRIECTNLRNQYQDVKNELAVKGSNQRANESTILMLNQKITMLEQEIDDVKESKEGVKNDN